MAIVLEHVGDVASESTNSQSFHVPGSAQYIELLEADPDIMKLVGESYTSGSYKPFVVLVSHSACRNISIYASRVSPYDSCFDDSASRHADVWSTEGYEQKQSLFHSLTSQHQPSNNHGSANSRIISSDLVLIQPFTGLGFDTLARTRSFGEDWDLTWPILGVHGAYFRLDPL
jgi:hypothetical protein